MEKSATTQGRVPYEEILQQHNCVKVDQRITVYWCKFLTSEECKAAQDAVEAAGGIVTRSVMLHDDSWAFSFKHPNTKSLYFVLPGLKDEVGIPQGSKGH